MRPRDHLAVAVALGAGLLTACVADKDEAKGVVDDSLPPALTADPSGKADEASLILPLVLESPHPYTNNLDRVWRADLSRLPSCAKSARLHFAILRTEPAYDFVTIEPSGGAVTQSFDGTHDDSWTGWFGLAERYANIRLTTDGSVTRHGFVIDRVEWQGRPVCPVYPIQQCPEGTMSIQARVGTCECPPPPTCAGLDAIAIQHATSGGRMYVGKQLVGTVASTLGLGADDRVEATPIGTIAAARLVELVRAAEESGVLFDAGYERPVATGALYDTFTIEAGSFRASFVAPQGGHSPAVAAAIASFDALFTCAGTDAPLSCDSGLACEANACTPVEGCVCTKEYHPMCGVDGRTYGNECMLGCAEMALAHPGACGQVGDTCGGRISGPCLEGNKCRYDVSTFVPPFRDAAGTCVADRYCDAPVDCQGLIAPAVVGSWTCPRNTCVFVAGPQWAAVTDGRFETAHPYSNSTSVFKTLTLPAGARAMRLVTTGTFQLENGFDYLEVWSWQNSAWRRVARFTGTSAPAATTEYPGRNHTLRFVSDSTITGHGFTVRADWR